MAKNKLNLDISKVRDRDGEVLKRLKADPEMAKEIAGGHAVVDFGWQVWITKAGLSLATPRNGIWEKLLNYCLA